MVENIGAEKYPFERQRHVAYLINQGVQQLIIKERLGHRDGKETCVVLSWF